ncbi:hypothetical protein RZS08_66685, partial [Arthrospira platensis SPKY1]|nr:hypothetical protein [Arthrospira platensis SPKY1]
NLFQAGASSMPNISIFSAFETVQVDPTDNCDWDYVGTPPYYTEATFPGDCGGPSETIIRVWTVVDPSGNESSCTQTITRERPTLASVELPPMYDGMDADM